MTSDDAVLKERQIPNTYMRIFLRVLGFDPRLLEGTEQTAETLAVLGGVHSLEDYARFLGNAEKIWPESGVGLRLGALGRLVGVHGSLSVAVLNSRTLQEALDLTARFASQRNVDIAVAKVAEPDRCGLELRFQRPYTHGRTPAIEIHLLAMQRMLLAICGTLAPACTVDLDFPSPAYANRYHTAFMTTDVRFEQPRSALWLPRNLLDSPNELEFDDALREGAIARLERNQRPDPARADVVLAVREILANNPGKLWRVGDMAEHLHMSSRTLQRRIASEGLSFQRLLDDSVMKQARYLLRQRQISVESIANLLGYSDVSNFRQAFRRVHACSPTEYRGRLGREIGP